MSKHRPRMLPLFMLGVSLLSCGYFSSGQWEDDPKNLKRAWGYSKPWESLVVHSSYWRSPHWTREESYFFQFRGNDELLKQMIDSNKLRPRLASQPALLPNTAFCRDKPAWFLPKPFDRYDVWECPDAPTPDWPPSCLLFKEKTSNDLFLYACQL